MSRKVLYNFHFGCCAEILTFINITLRYIFTFCQKRKKSLNLLRKRSAENAEKIEACSEQEKKIPVL